MRTNLEGALLGAKAAISRMMGQHGGGKVCGCVRGGAGVGMRDRRGADADSLVGTLQVLHVPAAEGQDEA